MAGQKRKEFMFEVCKCKSVNKKCYLINNGKNDKKNYYFITLILAIIVIIKVAVSLKFPIPIIYPDELVYSETAKNVLNGIYYSHVKYCQTYPPGYSILLSIAYLLSADKMVIYHFMLILNCILTSLILIPSYFILNKYIEEQLSLLGAVSIVVLPSVFSYTYIIMSENLFVVLFIFSIWFLINAFENKNLLWKVAAGFSVFYLFLTRSTGIAMIFGFFCAFLCFSKNMTIRDIIRSQIAAPLSLFTPLICWIYYKHSLGDLARGDITFYNSAEYTGQLISALTNISSFKTILILILNDISYLIVASYFLIFFSFIILLISLIKYLQQRSSVLDKFSNIGSINEDIPVKSSMVYLLTSGICLILISVTHMYINLTNYNDISYFIFGRYIDPIVPALFIFGLIGIRFAIEMQSWLRLRSVIFATMGYLSMTAIVVYTIPHDNFKFPNVFAINYLERFKYIFPVDIFLIALSVSLLILFYFILCKQKYTRFFFIAILLISLIITSYMAIREYSASVSNYNKEEIQKYLYENLQGDKRILLDNDAFNNNPAHTIYYSTIFWSDADIEIIKVPRELTSAADLGSNYSNYLISNRCLPFKTLVVSRSGNLLYDISDAVGNNTLCWDGSQPSDLRLTYWSGNLTARLLNICFRWSTLFL